MTAWIKIIFFSLCLIFTQDTFARRLAGVDKCSFLKSATHSVYQAKNWSCYIEIKGFWAEEEKSAMCHGKKPSKLYLIGSERANESIILRNTSYKKCQAEYARIQAIQKHSTNFGTEESFHSVRKKKKSRAPYPTYYHRKMTVEKTSCRFYEYRYQYYQF